MQWTSLFLSSATLSQSQASGTQALSAGEPTPVPEILAEEGSGKRPWYFGKLSSKAVEYAIKERKSDVAQTAASSVAARIVDAALEFPEATQVLNLASSIFVADGETVQPSHMKLLASKASSGYNAAKTSPGFKGYLHYISDNMKDFNVVKDPNEVPSKDRQAYDNFYSKMQETQDGKDAIKIGEALYSEVMHDVGVTPPAKPGSAPETSPTAHSTKKAT